jgi:hypothetical protein
MKENWVRGKMRGRERGTEHDPIWFLICIFYCITPPLSKSSLQQRTNMARV